MLFDKLEFTRILNFLFFAIRNAINLELQTIISTFVRKFGLDGLAYRIPTIEPLFNDLLHDSNLHYNIASNAGIE